MSQPFIFHFLTESVAKLCRDCRNRLQTRRRHIISFPFHQDFSFCLGSALIENYFNIIQSVHVSTGTRLQLICCSGCLPRFVAALPAAATFPPSRCLQVGELKLRRALSPLGKIGLSMWNSALERGANLSRSSWPS